MTTRMWMVTAAVGVICVLSTTTARMYSLGGQVGAARAEVARLKRELTEVQKRDRRCLMHAVELP